MWLPVSLPDTVENGTWRLTFSYPALAGALVPNSMTEKVIELGDYKRMTLKEYVNDQATSTVMLTVVLEDSTVFDANPSVRLAQGGFTKVQAGTYKAGVPLGVIITAIAGVFLVGLLFLTLQKVEKLIDSPAGSVFVIAVGAFILFIIFAAVRHGRK